MISPPNVPICYPSHKYLHSYLSEFHGSSEYSCININYLVSGTLTEPTLRVPLLMSSALRLLCAPTQTTRHAFLHVHCCIKANACATGGLSATDRVTHLLTTPLCKSVINPPHYTKAHSSELLESISNSSPLPDITSPREAGRSVKG